MRIALRVDASTAVGGGHLIRCHALAEALNAAGHSVVFFSRLLPGNLTQMTVDAGFEVRSLPPPGGEWSQHEEADVLRAAMAEEPKRFDCLVIDHYGLDRTFETFMRRSVDAIVVIDDLADRPHDADMLLDQNLYREIEGRYDGLVPAGCRTLLGPEYVLLRTSFLRARDACPPRSGVLRRVLVFFGGADRPDQTTVALAALEQLGELELEVDVVVTDANPHRAAVEARSRTLPHRASFHCPADDMAALMSRADLMLGAGGATTWERCCLALPALVIAVIDHQVPVAELLEETGALRYLGLAGEVEAARLGAAVRELASDSATLRALGQRAAEIVDGRGAERVVAAMERG